MRPSPSYAPIPRSSPSRPIRALPCPTPIEKMVKRATELGGLEAVIGAAEAGHSLDSMPSVAIKVNIVHTDGVPVAITDWRVVKALIKAVHALTPSARISIAEGGVWIQSERTDLLRSCPSSRWATASRQPATASC